MQKIIIIDQHPLTCLGLQAYLEKQLPDYQSVAAYSDATLEAFAIDDQVALILVGLENQGQAELRRLTKRLFNLNFAPAVVVCYEHFDAHQLKEFTSQQTRGYVSKDRVTEELLLCIRKVLSGESHMCEKTSQYLLDAWLKTGKTPGKRKVRY